MQEDSGQTVDSEILLHFNFVPKWARSSSTENPYAHFEGGGASSGGPRDRGGRRGERGERGEDRRDSRPRRDRRPRETAEAGTAPRPDPSRAVIGSQDTSRRGEMSRPAPFPAEIRFLPERRYLGAVVKRIQHSRRAYPLAELAGLFLSRTEFHEVKMEVSRQASPDVRIALCTVCGKPFASPEKAKTHVVAAHLGDYFDVRERELPAPTGVFTCVARCRLNGSLLGPPNHHSYNDRLMEMHTSRFSNMSLDDFRRTIETVHDAELVEAWKNEKRVETDYVRKDAGEGAEPMPAAAARAWMEQEANRLIRETHRAVLPAAAARQTEDRAIQTAIREAWVRESRFPMTLMIALRPALRHMGMHVFKAAGNMTFISAVAPMPLDPAHAVEPIQNALRYLDAHPGCTREEMLKDLFPEADESNPARREVVGHLKWLTDKGHVIEFVNGSLAVPSHLPTALRHGTHPHGSESHPEPVPTEP